MRSALLLSLLALGCGQDRPTPTPPTVPVEAEPEEPAAEAPVASTEEPTPTPTEEPAEEPEEEPTEGDDGAELAAARRHCAAGWDRLQDEDLTAASRELGQGVRALRRMALESPGARRALGACLYNKGRLEEARQQPSAADYYRESLWYRDNDVVRRRLASVSSEEPTAEVRTAPASLFRFLQRVQNEACGGRDPQSFDWVGGVPDWHDTDCGVQIVDLALDGEGNGAVLVEAHSGFSPENYAETLESRDMLAVLDGRRWVQRLGHAVPAADGLIDINALSVELRELTGAAPPEVIVHVNYYYSVVPSATDEGGQYVGMYVCGEPAGPTPYACAELWERSQDSEEDPQGTDREVRFEANGRLLLITTRTDVQGGREEIEREETTLEALWRDHAE